MPPLSSLDGNPDLSSSMSLIFVHLGLNRLYNTHLLLTKAIIRASSETPFTY